ncbi:MAG: hypothetical protein ACO395_07495 [Pontimonas sp.]
MDGQLRYFGTDYEEALRRWYEMTRARGLSVQELAVQWLDWKKSQMLSRRTLEGYEWMARQVQIWFGKDRCPEWIEPHEVQRFLGTVGGPFRIRNSLVILRGMISWGDEMGLCGRPRGMRLWKGPPERVLRKARRGEGTLWKGEEIRSLMRGGTSARCRLMAALGINLGYGMSDLCEPLSVDQEGFVGGPRPKTGVPRLGWMWPETHALWEECKGLPLGKARSGHLFRQWRKHVGECGVDVGGRKHYDLRATLRTRMSEEGDTEAARLVMGHESRSVERFYLRQIARERVRSLLQSVRSALGAGFDGLDG